MDYANKMNCHQLQWVKIYQMIDFYSYSYECDSRASSLHKIMFICSQCCTDV